MGLPDKVILELELSDYALELNIRGLEMYARMNWTRAKQGFEYVESNDWDDNLECYPEIKERYSRLEIKHFKRLAERAYAVSRMLKRKLKIQTQETNQFNQLKFIYV